MWKKITQIEWYPLTGIVTGWKFDNGKGSQNALMIDDQYEKKQI